MPKATKKRAREADSAVPLPSPTTKRTRHARAAPSKTPSTAAPSTPAPPNQPPGPTTPLAFLLRAVNVSGRNACNMPRLAQLCTSTLGWSDPTTYVQSGNLIANVPPSLSPSAAASALRSALSREMGVDCAVLPRGLEDIERLISDCPYDVSDPTKVHVFFLADLPPGQGLVALAAKPAKEDRFAYAGGKHIFLSYPNGAGKAALSGAVIERTLKVEATARNWRTVEKIRELLLKRKVA